MQTPGRKIRANITLSRGPLGKKIPSHTIVKGKPSLEKYAVRMGILKPQEAKYLTRKEFLKAFREAGFTQGHLLQTAQKSLAKKYSGRKL